MTNATRVAALALVLALPAGCLTLKRVPLVYEPPKVAERRGVLTVAIQSVRDGRQERDLDESVAGPISAAVENALKKEIAAQPSVASVTLVSAWSDPAPVPDADLVLTPTLVVLGSTAPGKGAVLAGMVPADIVAGGAGSALVGRGETLVHAYAEVDIVVSNRAGRQLLDKRMAGQASWSVPRQYMGTPQTMSRVAGMALKNAFADLGALLEAARVGQSAK